jgi:hypothetical protein
MPSFYIATVELSMLGEVGHTLLGWPRGETIILGGAGLALYAAHGGMHFRGCMISVLYLRLLGATLCGLLIVKDKWPAAYLPTFWHFTLRYCLPFIGK